VRTTLRERVKPYDPGGKIALLPVDGIRRLKMPGAPALEVFHKRSRQWYCHSAIYGIAAFEVAFAEALADLGAQNVIAAP
jgi:hypothetical protein